MGKQNLFLIHSFTIYHLGNVILCMEKQIFEIQPSKDVVRSTCTENIGNISYFSYTGCPTKNLP